MSLGLTHGFPFYWEHWLRALRSVTCTAWFFFFLYLIGTFFFCWYLQLMFVDFSSVSEIEILALMKGKYLLCLVWSTHFILYGIFLSCIKTIYHNLRELYGFLQNNYNIKYYFRSKTMVFFRWIKIEKKKFQSYFFNVWWNRVCTTDLRHSLSLNLSHWQESTITKRMKKNEKWQCETTSSQKYWNKLFSRTH